MSATPQPYDVVILGAGYAGLMATLRLSRQRPLRIALVNRREEFLERVRLQESIVNEVSPRIASLKAFVAPKGIDFICGSVMALDAERRSVRISADDGEREITFEKAIYALGSTIDVDEVPGVAEHAYRLEPGAGPWSAAALRERLRLGTETPLRVIVVGGAETGIEIAGEIATARSDAEVTLVSRSRCGSFKGPRVEEAVRAELARLNVRMIDGQTVTEVRAAAIVTDKGRAMACDICVWAGGLRALPLARSAGLAVDPQGRIFVDAALRSISHPHILAVGDAARPLAPTGAPYRLSAFAALTSGAHAADVIAAQKAGRQLAPFSFSTLGQGIAIGRRGVGFWSYPDDKQNVFLVRGRTAGHIRNIFVWVVIGVLKLELRMPGFFFWFGRRRVSWHEANAAVAKVATTTARAA